jgi:transcriptional regulator with PAS, ATPase and Fis domain
MDSFLAVLGKQDFSPTAIVSSNIERQNVFARLDTLPSPETAVNLLIEEAMKRSKGNQSLAARLLGISQSALNKRLRRAEQRSDQN